MPADTSLSANESTTMTVTARFQDVTDITGGYNGGNASITVNVNASQDGGGGGFTPIPVTRIVYAYHTDERTIGTSSVTDGVGDYTELSSWSNGKTWFLKYELDGNNVIQNAWACQKFSFINEPVCFQGGNASYYTANRGIIEGLANTFTSNGGSCSAGGSDGSCCVGDLCAGATSYGGAAATDNSPYEDCHVYGDGGAGCR